MIRVTFTDDGSVVDLDADTAVRVEGKPWGLRVWQLRGVDGAMVGGRPVTVETYQEQIARLERERDEAEEATMVAAKTLCDWQDRALAAEKRLADLRAWADELANGQSDTPEGRRVAGDFRAVVYRIDGEDQ